MQFFVKHNYCSPKLDGYIIYSYTQFYSTTLDYEGVRAYDFTVTATDKGPMPHRSTPAGHVIIHVTDVNDNPPTFQQPTYNFTVEEESNVGLIIGRVSASDDDSGQNQIFTYQIESSNPNGSFFMINDQTGEISLSSRVDREQYSQHELVVVGVDQGLPSLTGSTTVSITIITAFGKVVANNI